MPHRRRPRLRCLGAAGAIFRLAISVLPDVSDQEVILDGFYRRVVGWSLDLSEVCTLLAIVRSLRARRVLEVGTFDGLVARNIARNMPAGGRVVTLDLPPEEDDEPDVRRRIGNATDHALVGHRYKGTPVESMIEQHFGNSMTMDWSSLGGPFDLIFIDACHKYEFVHNDTQRAISVLAPGGLIVWHDYGMFPGVSRAVDEFAARGRPVAIKGTRLAVGSFERLAPEHTGQ